MAPMSSFVLLPQHAPRHQPFPSELKETNTGLSFQPRKKGLLVFHSAKPSGGINGTRSQMLSFPLAEARSTELVFSSRLHKGSSPGGAAEGLGRWRSLPEWGHRGCVCPDRQTPCSSWLPSFPITAPPAEPEHSLSHKGCLSPRSLQQLHKPFQQSYRTALNYLKLPR